MSAHVLVPRLHERDLQGGRDVDLGAAPADQVAELLWGHARPAVEGDRDAGGLHDVGDPLAVEVGGGRVHPMGVADRGGEDVDPGGVDEVDDRLQRLDVLRLVAGHLLGPLEAFDLALDVGSITARLVDHLDALAQVLLDRQLAGVEEDRVPAHGETFADQARSGQ